MIRIAAALFAISTLFCPSVSGSRTVDSPVPIAVLEAEEESPPWPSEYRAACRRAMAGKLTYIRNIERGRIPSNDVITVADMSLDGNAGCERNRIYAFKVMNALVPDPTDPAVGTDELYRFVQLAHAYRGLISKERHYDTLASFWLRSGTGKFESISHNDRYLAVGDIIDRDWLKAFAAQPENLALAIRSFGAGYHWSRDAIVLELLTDPTSPSYNLPMAASLLIRSGIRDQRIEVAIKLLDPQMGAIDPELAAQLVAKEDPTTRHTIARKLLSSESGEAYPDIARRLVADYSPFVDRGEPDREAAEIWREIGRQYALSSDPSKAAYGKHIVATGSPHRPVDRVIPDIPGLVVLEEWPETLPEIPFAKLNRITNFATNYPRRALREEVGGVVEVGVLFNESGDYSKLLVLRSSGEGSRAFENLNDWSMRSLDRYVRPRIREMKLTQFEGRQVLVPMIEMEWRIGIRQPTVAYEDGRLLITGKRLEILPPERSDFMDVF